MRRVINTPGGGGNEANCTILDLFCKKNKKYKAWFVFKQRGLGPTERK